MNAQRDFATSSLAPGGPRPDRHPGRPRIAIMGEFSAGKSTLSNMLIGQQALPVKVTATQLPPVWISYGTGAPYRRTLGGEDAPVELDQLGAGLLADTEYIRIFHRADTLQLFDLLDLPGISDPNMPAEVWQRVMRLADAVIWCTHATQAWRQSEAAVWEEFSAELAPRSLLLATRFDKIIGARDRARVMQRLRAETEGLFRDVFPISLTEALAAEKDRALWEASGADALAAALVALSQELGAAFGEDPQEGRQEADGAQILTRAPDQPAACEGPAAVLPRRVTGQAGARPRPPRPARSEGPYAPPPH